MEKAKAMTQNAYCPYSHYHVGAAALLADGQVITGSNQENAAYPSGLCAERTTLFAANANHPDTPVLALAIACYTDGHFTTEVAKRNIAMANLCGWCCMARICVIFLIVLRTCCRFILPLIICINPSLDLLNEVNQKNRWLLAEAFPWVAGDYFSDLYLHSADAVCVDARNGFGGQRCGSRCAGGVFYLCCGIGRTIGIAVGYLAGIADDFW